MTPEKKKKENKQKIGHTTCLPVIREAFNNGEVSRDINILLHFVHCQSQEWLLKKEHLFNEANRWFLHF